MHGLVGIGCQHPPRTRKSYLSRCNAIEGSENRDVCGFDLAGCEWTRDHCDRSGELIASVGRMFSFLSDSKRVSSDHLSSDSVLPWLWPRPKPMFRASLQLVSVARPKSACWTGTPAVRQRHSMLQLPHDSDALRGSIQTRYPSHEFPRCQNLLTMSCRPQHRALSDGTSEHDTVSSGGSAPASWTIRRGMLRWYAILYSHSFSHLLFELHIRLWEWKSYWLE